MKPKLTKSQLAKAKPLKRRLCWTDAKKLCVHGVRLTEDCAPCASDSGGPFTAWDGVRAEWRDALADGRQSAKDATGTTQAT